MVLITHGLWQRRFGGSRDVLGQQIIIDGAPREIIGVVPEQSGFRVWLKFICRWMNFAPRMAFSAAGIIRVFSAWPIETRSHSRASGGRHEQYRARSGATLSGRRCRTHGECTHFARSRGGGLSPKCVAALWRGRVRFAHRLRQRCQSSTFSGVDAHTRIGRASRARRESQPARATTSDRKRLACSRWWRSRRVVLTLESRRHHRIEPAQRSALSRNPN